eukprot:10779272-Lingulodinium_polyedra.AAC.1
MGNPKRWRVDQEGCFQEDSFMSWCGKHHINIAVVAGAAHWQNGVVDRHIQTLARTYDKFLSEAEAGQEP